MIFENSISATKTAGKSILVPQGPAKSAQERSKTDQDTPKSAQDPPKTGPRPPQERPKTANIGPETFASDHQSKKWKNKYKDKTCWPSTFGPIAEQQ